MTWLGALRFGAPSHGGIILFVFGFLVSAFGLALASAPSSPDELGVLGLVLGPTLVAFGLPGLIVGAAILRHHRTAQLFGILAASLYGAVLASLGLAGSIVFIILGVMLFVAAGSLLVAYRRNEV